ncbi:MAG: phytanoyl-CoA dioxygenase family protein [Rhodospirillaceae bacterium]|nr:phytanoyl-CoA dioxygenase family protein [Rhodospirillaceae bacterium]
MTAPKALTQAQVETYRRDGYLLAENAVTPDQLAGLVDELRGWADESRAHTDPFGPETVDGRARFDMGAEHTAERPALRRANNPSEISDTYFEVMSNSRMTDMVADLVGPDVKHHHCKINVKMPASDTFVAHHQDFAFTPHTNDDVVTALLLLDDMDEENGCLYVVPGSHTGPMYTLFQDGAFVGRVTDEVEAEMQAGAVPITGKAGSVCLMHTRVMHGSGPNTSADRYRGLYICVYTAADAVPIARNPMPNRNEGLIVRGQPAPRARMIDIEVELPQQPKSASFFTVQGQNSATG